MIASKMRKNGSISCSNIIITALNNIIKVYWKVGRQCGQKRVRYQFINKYINEKWMQSTKKISKNIGIEMQWTIWLIID